MTLSKDLSDSEFEKLTITKKKDYVAHLIISQSGAKSVDEPNPPIAVVMAGVPGAGKTEFLDRLSELLTLNHQEPFVRIDLDEIVTIYPGYTPKTDAQFRSQGSSAVAKCVDVAKAGRYNMMIDGTFAGATGASITNIKRLLEVGYIVNMYFMHDEVETSWQYTRAREALTSRGIGAEEFKKACNNVTTNLRAAIDKFGDDPRFFIAVVLQKSLRDKDYQLITTRSDIDTIVDKGYNIDRLKNL